jgi:hypothetical protein
VVMVVMIGAVPLVVLNMKHVTFLAPLLNHFFVSLFVA